MALTNYVLQSIIGATLFFGFGWGLLGKIGTCATLALGVGIGIGQWFFSRWWLARFSCGPLEGFWRSVSLSISRLSNGFYLVKGYNTGWRIFSERIIK
jgi:uncharacterized protein